MTRPTAEQITLLRSIADSPVTLSDVRLAIRAVLDNQKGEASWLTIPAPTNSSDAAARSEHRSDFLRAASGYGRASTAGLIDGPYMSMVDAAEVHAGLAANPVIFRLRATPAGPREA